MLTVISINIIVVMVAVLIHYEFLYRITSLLPRLKIRHRMRIVAIVLIGLAAHAVEVWLFGATFYTLEQIGGFGHLRGNIDGTLMDFVYFSFTTYTTLGTGDIHPFGELRYLTGLESLTGLVLITWTASYIYLEMTRYWASD